MDDDRQMDDDRPPDDPALPAMPFQPAELAADPRKLAAVLATVLDQQSRDAAANRAQARALVQAVEGLAKSHEFLGMELREERGRARSLLAALVFVPLAVIVAGAFVAWSLWDSDARLETFRSSVDRDLAALRARDDGGARIESLRKEYADRIAATDADAAAVRTDLDATRAALAGERSAREARDREVAARLADAERDRADIGGLRSELASVRDVAGAERARADDLARRLAEAARAAKPRPEATSPAAAPAVPSPPPPVPWKSPPAQDVPPVAPAAPPDVPSAGTSADPPAPPRPAAELPPAAPPASRDPADLARIRTKLNRLLEGVTGAARYEVESLAGASGSELLDVRIVGRDDGGRTLRTVSARRAEITVGAEGGVRMRFVDGRIEVGERSVPFFDGAYTIALEGTAEPWRKSGLTCVRFE